MHSQCSRCGHIVLYYHQYVGLGSHFYLLLVVFLNLGGKYEYCCFFFTLKNDKKDEAKHG